MTADDHTPETNQDVFDDYVRYMLRRMDYGNGVPHIGKPIEEVIQDLENDEKVRQETALNLIAIAHVKFMFDTVFTPNPEEPNWAERMETLHPMIDSALGLCAIHLDDYEPQWLSIVRESLHKQIDKDPAEAERHKTILGPYHPLQASEWFHLFVEGYSSSLEHLYSSASTRQDFAFTNLFPPERQIIETEWLFAKEIELSGGYESVSKLQVFLKVCESWAEAEWEPSSKWHRKFVTDLIDGIVASPSDLTWENWELALNLCGWLIENSHFMDRELWELTDEEHGDFGTSLNLPVDCKEHWAWEFGRIAALWPFVDKDILKEEWFDLVSGWPNGLAAFSLIAPHDGAIKDDAEYLWLGAGAAWDNHRRDNFGRTWASELSNNTTDLSLHWLSQLGYLDGTRKLNQGLTDGAATKTQLTPAFSNELSALIGDSASSLEPPAIEQLAERLSDSLANREAQREIDARQEIYARLGDIVGEIPVDAIESLVKSEMAISSRVFQRPERISIGYQEAVEIALAEWLRNSGGRPNWPGDSIPKWAAAVSGMTRSTGERHILDDQLRKQFNARSAKGLAEALEVLRQLTKRERHARQSPPRPHVVREYVLGTESRRSIFELILRFAKKWPLKE